MKRIVSLFLWGWMMIYMIGTPTAAQETVRSVKIRLPWLHQSQYAGVYVAHAKGLFAKRGLPEIEILQGGPNIRPVDLVSSGAEQFSITGSTPFFNAYKEQRPLKVIATFDQTHAFCYFARKDYNITSPADFKGKRVGHKVQHEHNLIALLTSAGLTMNDVELVPVPPGMSLFLIDDPQKVVPIWPGHAADEPLFAEEQGIAVNYFFPEQYDGIPRIGNLLFTSKAFEQAHPDLVADVVAAILDGWYDAFAHIDEAVDITLRYMQSTSAEDRRHQKNMLVRMQDFMLVEASGNKIGWCDHIRWQQAFEFFRTTTPDVRFTLEEMLTNHYVEAYYQ